MRGCGPVAIDRMVLVRLLHPDEIGEGLFPVAVPVIWAGAVEAGVDQDGDVVEVGHSRLIEGKCGLAPITFTHFPSTIYRCGV